MESYTITDTDTGNSTETVYTFHPSYDRATEVVTETLSGGLPTELENRSYTYDETNWLQTITDVPSSNTIDYSYDNNGNTQTKVDNIQATPEYLRFTYNSRNQLIETIRGPPASEISQGTYAYNYRGMRIRHLGSERGDIEYIYDDQAIIDEVQNNTNTLVAHYRYAGKLLSLTTATDTQYYHFAALGTTANLSDSTGTNQTAYRVDPYGEITQQEGTSVNRQVFTGQEHDEQTGLIYFGARYYDPDSARFLTQDSYLGEFGTAPSLHRYLYAYGNPTVYVDFDGYSSNTFIDNVVDKATDYVVDAAVDYAKETLNDIVNDTVDYFSDPENLLPEKGTIERDIADVHVGAVDALVVQPLQDAAESVRKVQNRDYTGAAGSAAEALVLGKAKAAKRLLPDSAQQKIDEVIGSASDASKKNAGSSVTTEKVKDAQNKTPDNPGNEGTAVIKKYKPTKDNPYGHYSVEVKTANKNLDTHQVITSKDLSKTKIVDAKKYKPSQPLDKKVEIKLKDAKAAQKYQESIQNVDLGSYSKKSNSCVTHVCEVLRQGGEDISESALGEMKYLKKKGF